MPGLDYKALGVKVGLEIHQQLDTTHKLFCECPAELTDDEGDVFLRMLRPTRSELGDVDPAALFEWRRGRMYRYHAPPSHTCLVEADEEPPHPINREAVAIALGVAMALRSTIVDEIHVMRKTVIDGSNTSGFQRTAIVALGGAIEVGGKTVPIETIVVEEDAARKLGEQGRIVDYKLDRLGIPLIEIATAPVIETPEEAKRVALAIGRLLRLTGKVKRGLGTIRQDLNVSIRGGAKTEIKGVQRLELIPKVVENEVLRQVRLLEIKDELRRRGLTEEALREVRPVDLTGLLRASKSRVIKRALKSGGKVLGVKLPLMHGILGREVMPGRRFGGEVADYARFWAGVAGIIHSDELPGYGITEEEIERIAEVLGVVRGRDAFVLVADSEEKARKAIDVVIWRVKMALEGVPEETRAALEDGTTRYMRPRPGSARMYPETDIPPQPVTQDLLEEAKRYVPKPPDAVVKELVERYGLSKDLAEAVVDDERFRVIVEALERFKGSLEPSYVAGFFIVTLRGLRGEGLDTDSIPDEKLVEVLEAVAKGEVAREAAESIAGYLAKNPEASVDEAIEALGLRKMGREEVEKVLEEIVAQLRDEILKRGERAMGLVMGRAMAKLRGRADGRLVAEVAREKIREVLARRG